MTNCIFTKKGLKNNGKEKISLAKFPVLHINHSCDIEDGVTVK